MYRHQGMLPIGGLGCCGAHVPMGADETQASVGGGGGATTWVAGGIIVGLAVLMFAIDTKDPMGLKKA